MTAQRNLAMLADAIRHHQAGRLNEAERLYRQILQVDFQYTAEVHNNLGNLHKAQGRLGEAVESYERALADKPDYADAHNNLGIAFKAQGRLDEAVESYRQALSHRPDYAEAHSYLGIALQAQDKPEEAVESYRRALAHKPDDADTHSNLGIALHTQGRLDEAVASFRRALAHKPDFADAHQNLAIALLLTGRFEEGWKAHEWRWKAKQLAFTRRDFSQQQWQGEAGANRVLLIHAEQGFGDSLQFCRYAPLAAARGFRVILEVPPALARLMTSLPGVESIVPQGEPLPDFDLHCPMLSLPLAFNTHLDNIPAAIPYLFAGKQAVEDWRQRLGDSKSSLRVGLVWAGSSRAYSADLVLIDRRRSISPALLSPLFDIPNVKFYSLQKIGAKAPEAFGLLDYMDECHDFADTAALVANLDLIISVDTAVAHLAAALGKPVWLLNRFDTCWRWLQHREDSPWYPSLRLFRQSAPGDWGGVIREVAEALRSEAK